MEDTFARSLAVQMCESVFDCCLDRGLEEPGEQCHTKLRNAIVIEMIALEREKRSLQPAYVDTCLEAFRVVASEAADCESLPTPAELTSLCPELFSPSPEGDAEPGSPCVATYECRSPTSGTRLCFVDLNASTGICEWTVPVGAGEDCAASPGIIKQCPDGLVCGPTATCVAPGENGDVCVSGSCAAGQECTTFTESDPLCIDAVGPGEDCSATPDACREDYFCGIDLTCQLLPNPCADGCDAAFIFENVCVG